MTKLSEMAKNYEKKTTKNIADCPSIPIDITAEEKTYTREDGTEFTILETEINREKYRVPKSILPQLKVILQERPDTKHFTVAKTGTGMDTRYTVLPL